MWKLLKIKGYLSSCLMYGQDNVHSRVSTKLIGNLKKMKTTHYSVNEFITMVSRRVDRSTGEVYSFMIPDPTFNVLMDFRLHCLNCYYIWVLIPCYFSILVKMIYVIPMCTSTANFYLNVSRIIRWSNLYTQNKNKSNLYKL